MVHEFALREYSAAARGIPIDWPYNWDRLQARVQTGQPMWIAEDGHAGFLGLLGADDVELMFGRVALIWTFYVSPRAASGSAVAHELLQTVERWALTRKALGVMGAFTLGGRDVEALTRICCRSGYRPLGLNVMKELGDG